MVPRAARDAAVSGVSLRLPLVRHLPVLKLLVVAELALVARRHLQHLDPAERRRLAALVRKGKGLSPLEAHELRTLVGKLDPVAFAGSTVERLSPLPLPRKLTRSRY
jgi:hypothetical protein